MTSRERYAVGGRIVTISNLEKCLWPEDGYTKADLLRYFLSVGQAMLPFLKGRPASFTRWPDGIHGTSFYQKNPPPGTPDWIPTWEEHGTRYLLVEEPATFAVLVSLAVIEIHTWLSRVPHTQIPDLAVIDLDPMPPSGFEEVRRVGSMVKAALDSLGLVGFPKTSGARGLHVFLPVARGDDARRVVEHIRRLGLALRHAAPDLITLERRVKDRHGVYFDYGQNAATRTMAAPYSPRPLPGAPVSTPIHWSELPSVDPSSLTLATVPIRVEQEGDPWAHLQEIQQDLAVLRRI